MPNTFSYTCLTFVCLLWTRFRCFAPILIRLFVFMLLSCRSFLYILAINPLSDIWFANIFSHSVGFFLTHFDYCVNNVVMNMVLQISFQVPGFNSGYICRGGIAGSYYTIILFFFFFEELPYYFPQWLYNFTFPSLMHKCSCFSTSLSTLVIYFF